MIKKKKEGKLTHISHRNSQKKLIYDISLGKLVYSFVFINYYTVTCTYDILNVFIK